ncbi:MAG: T9SS type A sorting domain-containing protein [Lewinellaceae bacterium]|nr:T9SS type A sorting domain-containing protein [Lewinellaceae bacterium]
MRNIILCSLVLMAFSLRSNAQDISVERSQHPMVTKLTATWCPICGDEAWDLYKNMVNDLDKQALVVAAHSSTTSRLYSKTAADLLKNAEIAVSQPWFFFNTRRIGTATAAMNEAIRDSVQANNNKAPLGQAGLRVTFNPETRVLTAMGKAEFFQGTSGEYYLGLYLIEEKVIEQQANRGNAVEHRNVLRASFTESSFGKQLVNGSLSAGWFGLASGSITLDANTTPDQYRVAAILWRKTDVRYEVVNTHWTDDISFGTTAVTDLRKLGVNLEVRGNGSREGVSLNVVNPQAFNRAQITVFNELGQPVQMIYQGNLGAGQHQFNLPTTSLSAGWYVVRLQTTEGQLSQSLIIP